MTNTQISEIMVELDCTKDAAILVLHERLYRNELQQAYEADLKELMSQLKEAHFRIVELGRVLQKYQSNSETIITMTDLNALEQRLRKLELKQK